MDIGPFKPSYYEAPEGRELVIITFTLEPAIEGTDLKPSGPELHDVKDQPMGLVTYGLVSVRGEVERAFVVPVGTKLKTLKIRDVQFDLTDLSEIEENTESVPGLSHRDPASR